MHIPDGFVDAKTAVATAVLAAGGAGLALRKLKQSLPPSRVPLIGMASAFVFAAQMINFPVAGGTSGHLIGAALTAVLLGPNAAVLVMTTVLMLQCFLFADGGITALGANIFNLGVVAPWVAHLVYRGLQKAVGQDLRARLLAVSGAAWCSTVAAAIFCAGQLALSGTAAWAHALPAMALVHMLIGLGEAVITTLVVAFVVRARPELFGELASVERPDQTTGMALQGLLVSLGLVLFVAPFACSWPDGLEHTAEKFGFHVKTAPEPILTVPFTDYAVPGIDATFLTTILAGLAGTVVVLLLGWLLASRLAAVKPACAPAPRKAEEP